MTQTGRTFISQVRMAEYGSSQYFSKTDHDYDLSLSTSLSSEASKEIYLSNPPLEMDVRSYRFEPVLLLLPHLLLIMILMTEFTTLLYLSLYLLIAWGIPIGKFVYKYKKVGFIAHRSSLNCSALSCIVCRL